jgi:hypothetical protein
MSRKRSCKHNKSSEARDEVLHTDVSVSCSHEAVAKILLISVGCLGAGPRLPHNSLYQVPLEDFESSEDKRQTKECV